MKKIVSVSVGVLCFTMLSHAAEARYLQSDPIGLAAGPNTYTYVKNSPLMAVDPLGLDALVIAGGVKTHSFNPFGHVANAVAGAGVFSYGNDTALGSSVQAYIQSQSATRNQVVTLIPASPLQDALMVAYYNQHPGMNSVGWFNNCAARTNQALNAGGISTNDIPFPGGLSRDVGSLPNAQQFFIPQGGPIPQALLNILPDFERH